MTPRELLAHAGILGSSLGAPADLSFLCIQDKEGVLHLLYHQGRPSCPTPRFKGLDAPSTLSLSQLEEQGSLCPVCFSEMPSHAHSALETETAVPFLLLGAAQLSLVSQEDLSGHSGEALLERAASLDEDMRRLQGISVSLRRQETNPRAFLLGLEKEIFRSQDQVRRLSALPEVQRAAREALPPPYQPRARGRRRGLPPSPPPVSQTKPRLLVWRKSRQDLYWSTSPPERWALLVWLVFENEEYLIIRAQGEVADHFTHRMLHTPVAVVRDPGHASPVEIETALALWDQGEGALGTLEGALSAACSVLS